MNSPGHGNFKVEIVDLEGFDWPVGKSYGYETLAHAVSEAELHVLRDRCVGIDYVQIWDCTSGLMALVWSSKMVEVS